jgi:hypothetical protein
MPLVTYYGEVRDISKYPKKYRAGISESLSAALIRHRGLNYGSLIVYRPFRLGMEDIEPVTNILVEHNIFPNLSREEVDGMVFDWVGLYCWKSDGTYSVEEVKDFIEKVFERGFAGEDQERERECDSV